MLVIVYHGSQDIVNPPAFGLGRTTDDYGRGFYCTEDIDLAKEWACSKGTDGFANIYELDLSGLSVLNLNSSRYSILTWLAILTRYRTYWENGSISREAKDYLQETFFVSPEDYDIVRGYRADDSYFTFAKSFVSNGISLSQLKKAMHLGTLGEQIVLKSELAFSQITYLDSISVKASEYFKLAQVRDSRARNAYRKLVQESSYSGNIFMIDIIREKMKANDPRLQ